ncbi:MAG: sulfatase-like hydrolase/transferase [Candidatus Magasanikbacteria bacterium]|nr:sulfatase-like hydrolase/transferase [Candidatus Magasanikbacteria bacterium]
MAALLNKFPGLTSAVKNLAAAFFITAGWQWYHFPLRPHTRFVIVSIGVWVAVFVGLRLIRWVYRYLVNRFERHPFWRDEFFIFLDELFLLASLYFLVFFSRNELISLIYFSIISVLLYSRLDAYLARHPAEGWRKAGRAFFILSAFIFLINAVLQYFAFSHYILDSNIKYYNIVLFRSVAIAAFWLCGFAFASLLYMFFESKVRFLFLYFWIAFFLFSILVGAANVGVLYHTGLYLNPVVMEHAGNGGEMVFLSTTIFLIVLYMLVSSIFLLIVIRFVKTHRFSGVRQWYYYDIALIALSLIAFFTIASLRNTPEALIIKSFYDNWRGADPRAELNPVVQKKLERFGIFHDTTDFYINNHDVVYQSDKKLLPGKFAGQRPNIVVVFLESFSARLTGPYNPDMKNVTPGLNAMAEDKNTTVFRNVFNPSTPTVTGLISELCSILPPTGHNEIEQDKHLQSVYLYCLPEALKKNGYLSNLYITAIDKDFANKDSILASMGVEETWGTDELSHRISGEPLSWGYSDHQMFPVLFDEMKNKEAKKEEPFLLMLSTVDTHPPFDLVKDAVPYGDGKNLLLNTFHTTDDAFRIFWEKFKASEFASDTIVIAIADHAVFPTAYEKRFFPDVAGKMTFYDEILFQMYIPETILPKEVSTMSSAMDFAPTVMQVLGINGPNSFEGHSIFDDREKYPNMLGMHEFGLWINQETGSSSRQIDYSPPVDIDCRNIAIGTNVDAPLTLCEYLNYFRWKRLMFEQGRLWFSGS